ncbi:hypothetical protein L0152_29215 [bacterium]|nr:hypothetical protein [bacterium]
MKRISACPYCKSKILNRSDILECPNCKTAHHSECWREAGQKCTIYGCKGSLTLPPIPNPRPQYARKWNLKKLLRKSAENLIGYAIVIAFITVNIIEPLGIYEYFPGWLNGILAYTTITCAIGLVVFLVGAMVWALIQDLS